MSSSIHVVFILVCLTLFNNVFEVSSMPKHNPDSGEGCLVDGLRYKVDDTWPGPVGVCTTNRCHSDGTISALTCALVSFTADSGCTETEYDYTVQYPYCCPNVTCPDHNTS